MQWQHVKEATANLMSHYAHRVNGSVVRVYDSLVAFGTPRASRACVRRACCLLRAGGTLTLCRPAADHRNADPEWATEQSKFLVDELTEALKSSATYCHVQRGKTRVVVSLTAINKVRTGPQPPADGTATAHRADASRVHGVITGCAR